MRLKRTAEIEDAISQFMKYNRKVEENLPIRCMQRAEDGTQCEAEAIGSHSLQRRGALQAISESGHVLKFGPDKNDVPYLLDSPIVRQGVKSHASVFGGFCAEHDQMIFREIEQPLDEMTSRHVMLICFRAVCLEMYKKTRHVESLKLMQEMDKIKANDAMSDYVKRSLEGALMGLRDIQKAKELFERAIWNGEYGGFMGIVVQFDRLLPFAFTGAFGPERSFTGASCHNGDALKHEWDITSVFCGRLSEKNLFIMGGFQTHGKHLIQSFMRSFTLHSNALRSAYVLNLALSHIENTFFRESWYSHLSDAERSYIMSKFFEAVGPYTQPQYALIPTVRIHTAEALSTTTVGPFL